MTEYGTGDNATHRHLAAGTGDGSQPVEGASTATSSGVRSPGPARKWSTRPLPAIPASALVAWSLIVAGAVVMVASCRLPYGSLAVPRSGPAATVDGPGALARARADRLHAGWPAAQVGFRQTTELPADWQRGKRLWKPSAFPELRTALPAVPGAEMVNDDRQCALCHGAYLRAFAGNVHRQQGCERCHGPASRHLASRGQEPGSILSLKPADQISTAGIALTESQRSELCLQCHDTQPDLTLPTWRHSTHAHRRVACSDCHRSHYNLPPGTPPAVLGAMPLNGPGQNAGGPATLVQFDQTPPQKSLRGTSGKLAAVTPGICYRCHQQMQRLETVHHPHRIGAPFPPPQGDGFGLPTYGGNFDCLTCHDPHGQVRPETRKDLCLQCHTGPHIDQWHGAPHDLAGVGCTDCHNPHPKQGLPMAVDQPQTCYRCHGEKRHLEEITHPHQLLGPNGFNCSTCHQAHGRVTSATRTDLCLRCHQSTPTMAWHSSIHHREGVACADCHNPHPDTRSLAVAAIDHTSVQHASRLPMSVDEPNACYKCHADIFGKTGMPSHHPIREGRLVCSRCHDGHGQNPGNLKTPTINQLCYQCHAEKQGPFVWEHPPVTENCDHCHEPHGTVTNNLLRQPTTFLCLRCHAPHSSHGASGQCLRCHFVNGNNYDVGGGPRDPMIPTTPGSRQAIFTDCTQCHAQVHGSDFPSGFEDGHGMRR